MFADDTKIWTKIEIEGDADGLQQDLDRLELWSDTWFLRFNAAKCKVMHIGHDIKTKYYLHGQDGKARELDVTDLERDLGILVSRDMKPSRQCEAAASKARSILGLIYRHFKRLNKSQFLTIYKTYVRPHLEYCVQAWSPWLRKDVDCLEKVQRRATKLVSGLRRLTYEERLRHLNLTTLETRRKRGDLIEMYKLIKEKESVDFRQFFTLGQNAHGLRGHGLRVYIPGVRTELRRNAFSHRVISSWNGIPQRAVEAETVNAFKTQIESYIRYGK